MDIRQNTYCLFGAIWFPIQLILLLIISFNLLIVTQFPQVLFVCLVALLISERSILNLPSMFVKFIY